MPPLAREDTVRVGRVDPGNFTPSLSQIPDLTRVIRLVPPHEGCRVPLYIGFLPLPVDPISKAMAWRLVISGPRSTS